MKRLLAALFLALVVALVGPLGVASADPNQDLVSGTGLFGQGNEKALLHLNAKSGPSGDDPQGTFDFKLTDLTTTFDFSGRVTCLNVHDDNHATVGGVVTKSKASGVDEGNGVGSKSQMGGLAQRTRRSS
jgi:hypothetical protein